MGGSSSSRVAPRCRLFPSLAAALYFSMASVLKLSALLACVAQMSSASLQSGANAAEGAVALRGTADASGRPALVNTTLPMAAVDCLKTHGDKALMDACLEQPSCAWSEMSGCRDWSDATFCSHLTTRSKEDCSKEEIHHGGSKPHTVHCTWSRFSAMQRPICVVKY